MNADFAPVEHAATKVEAGVREGSAARDTVLTLTYPTPRA